MSRLQDAQKNIAMKIPSSMMILSHYFANRLKTELDDGIVNSHEVWREI